MESPYAPPQAQLPPREPRRERFVLWRSSLALARTLILLAWTITFTETFLMALAAGSGSTFFSAPTGRRILLVIGFMEEVTILLASVLCPIIGLALIRKVSLWIVLGFLLVPVFFHMIGSFGH